MRTINLLTYIILNNYLENINLQTYFIYIHRSGIYSVLYIYSESHLLVLLGSQCLQNLTFIITKLIQTLPVMDSYSCVGPAVCGISRTSSSVPTQINTHAKFYSLVGIHKYGRPLMIVTILHNILFIIHVTSYIIIIKLHIAFHIVFTFHAFYNIPKFSSHLMLCLHILKKWIRERTVCTRRYYHCTRQ